MWRLPSGPGLEAGGSQEDGSPLDKSSHNCYEGEREKTWGKNAFVPMHSQSWKEGNSSCPCAWRAWETLGQPERQGSMT